MGEVLTRLGTGTGTALYITAGLGVNHDLVRDSLPPLTFPSQDL